MKFLETLQRQDAELLLRQVSRPSSGTCAWITSNEQFRRWRDSPDSEIFWVSGAPGAGKTTLMRYLIETQLRWLQQQHQRNVGSDEVIMAFFFCDSTDPLRNNFTELMSLILSQILAQKPELFRYLENASLETYTARSVTEVSNTRESVRGSLLHNFVITVLQRSKGSRFWIFIDAIDELAIDAQQALFTLTTTLLQ